MKNRGDILDSVKLLPVRPNRSIPVFVVLAVLALLGAATSASRSTVRLLDADADRERADHRLSTLNDVLVAVVDAETGARGYVITGDASFLGPYSSGVARVPTELTQLETQYAKDGAESPILAQLRRMLEAHSGHHAQIIEARRLRGYAAAQALVATGQANALTDSIRGIIGAAVDSEQRALLEQRQRVHATARTAARNLSILFALALALFAVAVASLWLENRRRRAANAEVRELNRTLEARVAEIRADLERSEGRLREAMDGLLEGCAILDHDLRYTYVNRASAQQGRSTIEQMLGRTMYEVYPGFETTELHAAMRRTLDTQEAQTVELQFTFPDGSSGWYELHLQPVAEGIFALSFETTERVRAERAHQSREGRVRALLQGLPELVFLLDAQGTVLELHAPDETQLLRAADEIRGRALVASMPAQAAAALQAGLDAAAAEQQAQTVQYDLTFEDGTRRFEAIVVPTEGNRLTVVARDITARQQLEEQLRQAQKMEAVGQLTGGIAHDFNNVLTIIGSNAEMLTLADPGEAEGKQEVMEILRATRRGADMIAQLLSFSRRGMLKRQPVVVAEVVQTFIGMLERLIPASIRLEFDARSTTDVVRLDAGAMEQVLANLCTNARDAMPEGGRIRIACEHTWLDAGYHATHPWVTPGPYVCVSVSDTGSGMDEETRRRVFEPFYTTKAAGMGTGLGMAMVYGIMKEHEGMVHVYSEVGRGTVIKLYFPVSRGTPPTGLPVAHVDPAVIVGGGETILLAEDEPSIRLATRRALESKGYVIIEAADGEQALARFHENAAAIDLVISDLVMPNLGGRQLAEALRAERSMVPILFTSGYSSDAVYREGEMPAMVAFLHKPWTLTELFTRVRDILDGREMLD